MNKTLVVWACLLLPLLLISSLVRGSADPWGEPLLVALAPPQSGSFRQPTEPLQLLLPDNFPAALLDELTLELDAIDVSAMVDRQPNRLVFAPVQPLAAGERELRLMHYAGDGRVRELGFWTIDVRQSALVRQASMAGYYDFSLGQRLAERSQSDGRETTVQGSGQLQSRLEGDHWQMNASADLLYMNDEFHSPTGRTFDIPTFTLAANSGRYRLRAGDQVFGRSDLLFDGFQQRGLSTGVSLAPLDTSLTLFGASTSQQMGLDAGAGLDDRENRLAGARWSSRPLATDAADIHIQSAWVSGRYRQPHYASMGFGDDAVHRGSAWNLALDGQFLERRVRLRLESASSRYDFAGTGQGEDLIGDDAWSALLVYNPPAIGHATPLDWSLGLETTRVGTHYRSLANSFLPADKALRRVFATLVRGQWYLEGAYAIEDNNLDDSPDYATTETRQWHMTGGYSKQQAPEPGSALAWLGRADYSLMLYSTVQQDTHTPEHAWETDNTLSGMAVNARFQYSRGHWALGYGVDTLEDATGWQLDSRTRNTQLQAGYRPGQRYNLNVGWQLQQTLYLADDHLEADVSSDRQLYSVAASAVLIPNRLSGNLALGLNRTDARNDPFFAQYDRSTYVNGSVQWRFRQPKNNRAGLDLGLSFSRNDFRDLLQTADGRLNGYQVFLELRSSMPFRYPGGSL